VAPGGSVARAFGQAVEDEGLPSAMMRPMGPADYAAAAEAKAVPVGNEMGQILDRSSQLGVEIPKSDMLRQLRALRLSHAQEAGDAASPKMRRVERAIKDLESGSRYASKDKLTARDLQDLKSTYETDAGYRKGEAPAPASRLASKQASGEVATVYRRNLHDAMRGADEVGNPIDATGGAIQEDADRYFDLNSRYGKLKSIQGVARGAEGRSDMTGAVARGVFEPIAAGARLASEYGADMGATAMKVPQRLSQFYSQATGPMTAASAPLATGMMAEPVVGDDMAKWFDANAPRTPEQRSEIAKRMQTDPEFRARARANADK
jgi:hypothetical protein